jgi:transcriptional regulator with XRE-family HTH domain
VNESYSTGNSGIITVITGRSQVLSELPMALDTIAQLVSDRDPIPNKFTIGMGELIRKAREEAGLSQKELAERINRRQTTLSDIEKGKIEVGSGLLAILANRLQKPISYFYPPFMYHALNPEQLTPLEEELIIQFRNIRHNDLKMVVIKQMRAMVEFDPTNMILELYESYKYVADQEKEFLKLKRKNKNSQG